MEARNAYPDDDLHSFVPTSGGLGLFKALWTLEAALVSRGPRRDGLVVVMSKPQGDGRERLDRIHSGGDQKPLTCKNTQ